MLKTAGVSNVDKICDFAINGKIAVDIIKEDIRRNKVCSYDLILMD